MYAGASELPEVSQKLDEIADKCFVLNSLKQSQKAERQKLFRELLGSVGESFSILSPFRCDLGFNIHIGENFIANYNLLILDEAEVRIGDNVMIGPNCSLITVTHHPDCLGTQQGSDARTSDNDWQQCVDCSKCGGVAGCDYRRQCNSRCRQCCHKKMLSQIQW